MDAATHGISNTICGLIRSLSKIVSNVPCTYDISPVARFFSSDLDALLAQVHACVERADMVENLLLSKRFDQRSTVLGRQHLASGRPRLRVERERDKAQNVRTTILKNKQNNNNNNNKNNKKHHLENSHKRTDK